MFKKFFSKALIVLAIMITLTTLFSMSALAVEENTVMTVYTKWLDEEIYKEFDNFEDGWVFLMEKYDTYFNDFDVKLYADWVAPDGKFYYTNDEGNEVGTDKGRLAIGNSWYNEGGSYNPNKINIDLNGHKIDRNLKAPTENGQVFFIENGTVRIFDSSEAQTGMITGANNTGNGGAFLVDNGALNINKSAVFLEGGTISGNYAANGAGIYWNSDGLLILTDGAITGNHATEKGGGLYVNDWGGVYVGGTPVIKDNYIKGTSKQSNLYIGDTDAVIKLTRGQESEFSYHYIPDLPLSEGAQIGISTIGDDEKLTDENSLFREEDFTYFFPDDTTHFVRSVHSEEDGVTSYDLYYTSWENENKRAPRVTNVSVKDYSLVKGFDLNCDKQILTLTVANNKRDYFNTMSLDRLVSLEFNDQRYYLGRIGNPLNLHESQQYRIMADNGTYVLLIVNIVPEGGKWAQTQDPYVPEYAAVVFNEHYAAGYTDIGKAWADAVKQSLTNPTTFKMLADWIATDGEFYAEDEDGDEYGTDDGYLDIDDENINLIIDLNGHTIDRNLDEPVSNGYIMYIGEGIVTITDTSEEGNGKITGGNNTGDGGAIFMDNGLFGLPTKGGNLIINGGNITGNHSDERGGAIYTESQDNIVMNRGKITNNTAEKGGAIALTAGAYAFFNNGEVSGNSATKYGGAFYCYDGGTVVVQGSTVVSNNTAPYGGCVYVEELSTVYFYSGYIKNNTADYGGGIYTYGSFVMGGSNAHLSNNVARYNGGGVYALGEYGEIRINFGNITGNKAVNGAGIYWDAYSEYFGGVLNNVIITENEASGIGGGVYVDDDRSVFVGGRTVIRDNTSSLGTDNLNLIGYDSAITNGIVGFYDTSLTEGAEIGIRAEKIKSERIIVSENGSFEKDSINYFTADDAATSLTSVEDANYSGYRISLVDKYDGEMLVEVEGGDTKSFENFGKGWVYALQQSLTKPTTITLGADWIAYNGMFYCVDEDGDEYGTNNGYLYINDDHIITIDLNGHKIDRNLKTATDDGVVFWLYDYDAKLTIKDSFGGGKITGANNTGNGGAFLVKRGSLYIEGGEISGNKAANGAGIYWESMDVLSVLDCKITGNTATVNGGGIYGTDWGDMYFGGLLTIKDNTGMGGTPNNLYLEDPELINNAQNQLDDVPDRGLEKGSCIGVTAYEPDVIITGEDNRFGLMHYDSFHSDSIGYHIYDEYSEVDGETVLNLYFRPFNETLIDNAMTVEVSGEDERVFNRFSEGWVYALQQSLSNPVTIKLGADWIAPDSIFVCRDEDGTEYGSKDGYLFLNDSYDITIDLNGHKIDRNLATATKDGIVFRLNNENAKLTIKDSAGGGKITGANNTDNGGAFLVEGGSLYITGGEISGNKANSGAGIYWTSNNTLCIYNAEIINNTAKYDGGGIYDGGYGKIYFGGRVRVTDNIGLNRNMGISGDRNNLYLSASGVRVYITNGQEDGIPVIPLDEESSIGISTTKLNTEFSRENSGLDWNDHRCFFADFKQLYIRAFLRHDYFNDNQLYYGLGVEAIQANGRQIFVRDVEVKEGKTDYVHSIYNNGGDELTMTCHLNKKSELALYTGPDSLSELINLITPSEVASVEYEIDWDAPVSFIRLVHQDGTYELATLKMNWICINHDDFDYDCYCDYCDEQLTESKILEYDEQTKKATVFVPEAGKYVVVFADYENDCLVNADIVENENDCLVNMDIVEYEFKEGYNFVSQENSSFTLASDDKVMLWYDMIDLVPICEALTVK